MHIWSGWHTRLTLIPLKIFRMPSAMLCIYVYHLNHSHRVANCFTGGIVITGQYIDLSPNGKLHAVNLYADERCSHILLMLVLFAYFVFINVLVNDFIL